jgi:hypothetical protein
MNEHGSPWPTSSCWETPALISCGWESSLHISSAAEAPCRYHASGKQCADTKLLRKGSEDLKMLAKAGHISTYWKCAMLISLSWQRLGRYQEEANSPPRSHDVSGQGWADIKLLGKHRGHITLLGSTGQISSCAKRAARISGVSLMMCKYESAGKRLRTAQAPIKGWADFRFLGEAGQISGYGKCAA